MDARFPRLRVEFDTVTVSTALAVAHLQQAVRRALDQQARLAVELVQGGHVLAFRLEGDGVLALVVAAQFAGLDAGLGRGHHQRAFGGVAVDQPAALLLGELGVVAQHPDLEEMLERRLLIEVQRVLHLPVVDHAMEVSFWREANALDTDLAVG